MRRIVSSIMFISIVNTGVNAQTLPSVNYQIPPETNNIISISKILLGVNLKRRVELVVMNGGGARLYQVVPTARGNREPSIGENQGRLLFYCEIIPRVLKVSFERVWSMEENLKCLSISLTHGKYIRH